MGTKASVAVYGLDEARSQVVADAVFAEWARVEKVFSWYDPQSELSLMNRAALRGWAPVSQELFDRVAESLELHRLTGGRFDPTFSPLWELWRRSAREGRLPSAATLKAAKSRMGAERVRLDAKNRRVRFLGPVSVNLGGTVKDYALRRGLMILEKRLKKTPVLLDLGGDLLAWDFKRPPWTAGVRHPFRPDGLLGALRLPEGGLVLTSGSYERFVEVGGRRFCHILDAKSGRPLEGMSSFTLALPEMTAHPPSVALALLGREAALAWVRSTPGAFGVWADEAGGVETAAGPLASIRWAAAP